MMKTLATAIVAAALMTPAGFAEDRPAARQKEQQKRIAEGVESGELTKKEAKKLEQKEARIHRKIRRDRKDGGGLTAAERAKIEARQDAASADIYKQKHDEQKKKDK